MKNRSAASALANARGRRFFSLAYLVPAFAFVMFTGINCSHDKQHGAASNPSQMVQKIHERLENQRGICVLLSDTLTSYAVALAQQSELLLYIQLPKATHLEASRNLLDQAGFLNSRIYVEAGDWAHLHLADNLVDLLILEGEATAEVEKEILRVLHPQGVALLKDRELVKPFPDNTDDWSHPFHGPDNNPQSKDKVARAPYLTQFLAEPHYAPATQVAVASAGRLFKGFGSIAWHEREEAYLNKLVAFNGYNGTLLWQRDLVAGIMLHRNTMIATPEHLYVGDDKSCKLYSAKTGELAGEISVDADRADGTFWKWMGLQDGVLYALIGEQEVKDPTLRWKRQKHGWPWDAISPGFNQEENPWGFGRDFFAINPNSKRIKWHYHEEEAIDSRALCMNSERVFLFRFGAYLTCLDAGSGKKLWRKTPENAPELFNAIGIYLNRQGWDTNWRTRNYVMCSDDALYFAGPQINKLLAVSAKDGSVLWENPFNNFQLVLRDDGLYAIAGIWRNNVSKKFDPLTGAVLADLPTSRRACTRPTGSADAILFRADDGTVRLDMNSNRPQWISPMRPPCFDGVTIANGFLYWWPYVCDCQLSIYGITAVGPAGDFNFQPTAVESDRLHLGTSPPRNDAGMLINQADWCSYRKNNIADATTPAAIPAAARAMWRFPAKPVESAGTNVLGHAWQVALTAPVTADGLIFYSGSDGIVRCLDEVTGEQVWKAYTGGAVRFPPTIYRNKVLVGSGDGYVHCFMARTGERAWSFRTAPLERKIPVYGSLLSTWPAASGILVHDGIAYVACGIVNYDGTYVFALDADTGKIKWQNNTSGHLLAESRTGASVQGHMLIHDGKLYLAGGTSLSPAVYDLNSGACLNDPESLNTCDTTYPRGSELYLLGNQVVACGKPFYSRPEEMVYDPTVTDKLLHSRVGNRDIVWVNQSRLMALPNIDEATLQSSVMSGRYLGFMAPMWKKLAGALKPIWEYDCKGSQAVAVGANAIAVADAAELVVLSLQKGEVLWRQPLDYAPLPWGMAVSRAGRIILTLADGSVRCFGGESTAPTPFVSSNNTYFVDSTRLVLNCNIRNAEIRYTLDGSEPTQHSALYTKPILVNESGVLHMRSYARDGLAGYVVSEPLKKVKFEKEGVSLPLSPGIRFTYHEGSFSRVSDMDRSKPAGTGLVMTFAIKPRDGVEEYGYVYEGYVLVPQDGVYTFYLESNDGSKMYLNDQELIDNDGPHGAIEKSGKMALKKGAYPLAVKYFQMGGAKTLQVRWEGPGMAKQELTAQALFHKP